ncbi:hypothetical protein PM082_022213 [Marasmius tenuissimus]|nr:hypothetical protein PM082_022213 [Marasmius tenuissimus]
MLEGPEQSSMSVLLPSGQKAGVTITTLAARTSVANSWFSLALALEPRFELARLQFKPLKLGY